ncbi:MAG TPA: DUF6491 family protein [Rhizomicrobium sp.]
MRSILFAALSLPIACGAAQAQVQAQAPAPNRCFSISQFRNWRAADDKTLYIRVGVKDVYRLDLSYSCKAVTWPDARLITTFRGSSTVCTALDWDIKVGQSPPSIPVPCMVKKMTALTPAESAALPKGAKP